MSGVNAHGTKLTIGSAIANLTGISGPSISVDTIDVTSHDSEDGWREFVGGLKDAGEVSVEGNFTGATEGNVLLDMISSGEVQENCTIEFPTTPKAQFTFDCIVTGYEADAPFDDKLSFSATLKITGKPTLAEVV